MKKLQLTDIIETERLIIKIPEVSETKTMYDLIDDSTTEFMEWEKWPDLKDTEKNLLETIEECSKWVSWQAAIYLKNWELIGRFWMHTLGKKTNSIYLWYWISSKQKGKWYIPECVEWMKQYGFTEMWLNKIMIRCVKENTASRKVAEKCWFKLDWILRDDEFQKWKYVDNRYYSFLKEDFNK